MAESIVQPLSNMERTPNVRNIAASGPFQTESPAIVEIYHSDGRIELRDMDLCMPIEFVQQNVYSFLVSELGCDFVIRTSTHPKKVLVVSPPLNDDDPVNEKASELALYGRKLRGTVYHCHRAILNELGLDLDEDQGVVEA